MPKKNKNFIQFNKLMPQILLKLSSDKPNAIPVYMTLVSVSNNLGCSIVPQSSIAEQVGKSIRTVARLLNYLATKHYIAIARSGRANVYILNYNLIWKNYYYKKSSVDKYIRFPTNVVLTQTQNPKFFEKFRKFIKRNGHKNIDLNKISQKNVTPNKNPNRNKISNSKLKTYPNKAEAENYNGYYQPNLLNKRKTPERMQN